MAEEMVERSPSQEEYGRVLFAIRLLVLLVLLGWIFIWIMVPTNTYKQKWQPQLRAKTSTSTYFGAQGLIIFSFNYAFTLCFCIPLFYAN